MIEQMYSILKNPKVLPILVFFLLVAVTQSRWNYVATKNFDDATEVCKIDRFTGFRYVDIFSRSKNIEGGTYPAYSYIKQTGIYNMAKFTDDIETTIINILFAWDFVWLFFVYIVKPLKGKYAKSDTYENRNNKT